MQSSASHYTYPVSYGADYQNGQSDFDRWEIDPGERVVAQPRRRRGKRVFALTVLLAIMAGGWKVYDEPALASWLWSFARDTAYPALAQAWRSAASHVAASSATSGADTAASQNRPAEAPQPSDAAQVAAVQPAAPPPAPEQSVVEVTPPPAVAAPPEPQLPPAAAPLPKSRTAARAEAAGLHPSISPALLARLTDADFKNAAYAIRTALDKTPDDGTFRWPRKAAAQAAVFEVRFVQGAASGCRRYVVTIEKNRWVTTAAPLEKCGTRHASAAR